MPLPDEFYPPIPYMAYTYINLSRSISMENRDLVHPDLINATNPELLRLKEAQWRLVIHASRGEGQEEALVLDLMRAHFHINHIKSMDLLSELKLDQVFPALQKNLIEQFPEITEDQINTDAGLLQTYWNQQIATVGKNAMQISLLATDETRHLMVECAYEINLTYENGKMYLMVDYFH